MLFIIKLSIVTLFFLSFLVMVLSMCKLAVFKKSSDENYLSHFLAFLVASATFSAALWAIVTMP